MDVGHVTGGGNFAFDLSVHGNVPYYKKKYLQNEEASPVLIGTVVGPDLASARRQIETANRLCDGVELRLDRINADIQELLTHIAGITVLTTEEPSEELFGLAPDYLMIPWHTSWSLSSPHTQLIRSYHNFDNTPDHLEEIIEAMPPADLFKITTFARSTCDALRMLLLVRKQGNMVGLCMGERGAITRILSPLVHNPLHFCAIEEPAAPGQLSAEELQSTYFYDRLSSTTTPYGLIGDPIVQSPSHLTHNRYFEETGHDAVYVKMQVSPEELPLFLSLAKEFGFAGLSVTMPHKEAICRFVDVFHGEKSGAVNTLAFRDKAIHGTNTDGKAALDLLEETKQVAGAHLVILGAGGAARGIGFEAVKRGALVTIASRTAPKGKALAEELGGRFCPLDELPACDYIINTTPSNDLLENKKETPCVSLALTAASAEGPPFARQMFWRQALGQFTFWQLEP